MCAQENVFYMEAVRVGAKMVNLPRGTRNTANGQQYSVAAARLNAAKPEGLGGASALEAVVHACLYVSTVDYRRDDFVAWLANCEDARLRAVIDSVRKKRSEWDRVQVSVPMTHGVSRDVVASSRVLIVTARG